MSDDQNYSEALVWKFVLDALGDTWSVLPSLAQWPAEAHNDVWARSLLTTVVRILAITALVEPYQETARYRALLPIWSHPVLLMLRWVREYLRARGGDALCHDYELVRQAVLDRLT